jgi:hypothetical protein
MRLVVLKTFGALRYRLAQCVSAPVMSLAPYIFLFLALMDPFAILALLPGTEAASDQDDVPADSDGGADAASDHGNLLPGADAVSDQGNLSADADGGADDQDYQPRVVRRRRQRQKDRTRIQKKKYEDRKRSKVQLRMKAQALQFNNSGPARTYDHLLPVPATGPATRKRKASGRDIGGGGAVPAIIRGKGRYKSPTPEYISRMAFAAANTPLRALTAEGGGGRLHAGNCGLFLASCIESHEQAEACRRNGESRQG